MPRSEERGGMAAHSEAEANSLLVYKSPAWKGGVLYCNGLHLRLQPWWYLLSVDREKFWLIMPSVRLEIRYMVVKVRICH